MTKELSISIDGIALPEPVSPDDYRDESFREDYDIYVGFQRNFGPQEVDVLSLSEYASHCRAVTIPLREYIHQWEQIKYSGKANWNQEAWNRVHSQAENALRSRYEA